MRSYGQFAYIYDNLMTDVPYEKWIHYFKQQMFKANMEQSTVLDLGCGTGEIAIRLAKEGYSVVGVDLSDDMLMVANEKAKKEGISLSLYEQNMAELELMTQFDCVVIFCDSLNYLQTDEEVKQTLTRVYEHLKPGGLLLFDVHSVHKVKDVFGNNSFSYVDEDVSYIWDCSYNELEKSVDHDITFFVYDEESDAYHRFDEVHTQRTMAIDTYKEWLLEVGFKHIHVTADFEAAEPVQDSERIFFSVQK
ncbi:class I SAM-dependent methyltransferase [Priestia megaterium]|nr:class I SAM-dependent methyltransferase [Priestia megaterium]